MKIITQQPPKNKSLLTRAEVAGILGISKHTVWNLERRGLLKPIRLSQRTLRYKAEEVENALSNLG